MDCGEIVPSKSEYASPAVFLPNKTSEETELYVDFTKVNKNIPIIAYDKFDSIWCLVGLFKRLYCKSIEICHPYRMLIMNEEAAAKTAFVVFGEKFQFTFRSKGF